MPDELYVRARAALLDAVAALGPHLEAIVLVGAQAIYIHSGDADLAVAEYTTDADFTISPHDLADEPLLAELLEAANFTSGHDVGRWLSPTGIFVDLMAPEALAGPGARGARLGPHGKRTARRARGLEGALVDRDRHTITALDPSDDRSVTMWVAGPGALLVAKLHTIADRGGDTDRVHDKDALDVLRLLRAIDSDNLASRLRTLRDDELAAAVTAEALDHLASLFGSSNSEGVAMAIRSAGGGEDPGVIAGSFVALVDDLEAALA